MGKVFIPDRMIFAMRGDGGMERDMVMENLFIQIFRLKVSGMMEKLNL